VRPEGKCPDTVRPEEKCPDTVRPERKCPATLRPVSRCRGELRLGTWCRGELRPNSHCLCVLRWEWYVCCQGASRAFRAPGASGRSLCVRTHIFFPDESHVILSTSGRSLLLIYPLPSPSCATLPLPAVCSFRVCQPAVLRPGADPVRYVR